MNPKWLHKYQRKPGRWVFAPTPVTKALGKEIKAQVEEAWNAPDYFFHLRAGGHVRALKVHSGHVSFVRLDIQDFFGSVNRTRVTRCLKPLFGYRKARELAVESTVQHPTEKGRYMLPFGFVQSPILASMALAESKLGTYLHELAATDGFAVSIYVDDIIISGPDDDSLKPLVVEIQGAAKKARFELNPSKQQGPASIITAFNIELENTGIRVQKDRLDVFKEAFQASISDHQKMGIFGYVRSIDATQAESLKT